jgi:septum formation protein
MGESTHPLRLILASASPARAELLARTGRPFEVMPSSIEEPTGFGDPQQFVQAVAWLKAREVAARIEQGLILAADTIAWLDGQPILKPEDESDARRILGSLSGREHELWTGVVLWRRPDDLQISWQERSLVHFTAMDSDELERYLTTRSWKEHSGGYAILEQGDPHVRVVAGSVTNVIGLPMESLTRVLDWLAPPTC